MEMTLKTASRRIIASIFYSHFQCNCDLKAVLEVLCCEGEYEKAAMLRIKQNLKQRIKASRTIFFCIFKMFSHCFSFESLYFNTSCLHPAHKLSMPPPSHQTFLSPSLLLHMIYYACSVKASCAAESSMPFAGHQRRLCLRGTLLPAGLWMLVAISTLKFDCCGEMKALS